MKHTASCIRIIFRMPCNTNGLIKVPATNLKESNHNTCGSLPGIIKEHRSWNAGMKTVLRRKLLILMRNWRKKKLKNRNRNLPHKRRQLKMRERRMKLGWRYYRVKQKKINTENILMVQTVIMKIKKLMHRNRNLPCRKKQLKMPRRRQLKMLRRRQMKMREKRQPKMLRRRQLKMLRGRQLKMQRKRQLKMREKRQLKRRQLKMREKRQLKMPGRRRKLSWRK